MSFSCKYSPVIYVAYLCYFCDALLTVFFNLNFVYYAGLMLKNMLWLMEKSLFLVIVQKTMQLKILLNFKLVEFFVTYSWVISFPQDHFSSWI